ncbi:hypothetical protein EAI89_21270 [Eubacterium sp. am_0171]|uniref:hypothetical protein n=1 Tax=unclassified Eubacterium (in: firmicutes) TaxID=2624479 RepID=UPI001022124E|nr:MULTISPECIES: hypothetical protein [unclassified Eubacterium (in: firmicutes)]MSC86321.1 hypothetical protein [Eubacterium sp. BIOML-A1]MSD08660.1 hypothetical protein [Eubacterium sp. BIOML-A2]RYT11615.1 hypothetical protein EAI89_21270 [Eubacterium sp. am_0171]
MFEFLKKKKEKQTMDNAGEEIVAVVNGTIFPLEEVSDPAFAGKILGDAITDTTSFYMTKGTGGGVHAVDGWYASSHYFSSAQEEFLKKLQSGLQTEADQKMMESILAAFAMPRANRLQGIESGAGSQSSHLMSLLVSGHGVILLQ